MVKKLSSKSRQWIIGIHLVFIAGWLGSSFVLLMLSLISLLSGNKIVGVAIPDIMHYIDLLVIIPSALGIIITGVLLSALTQCGFIKYRWIIFKEIVIIFLIVLGAIWLSPLVLQAMHLTAMHGIPILGTAKYRIIHIKILCTSIIVLPLLIGMVIISKLKPWGKRKGYK